MKKADVAAFLSALNIFESLILILNMLSMKSIKIYVTGNESADLIFFLTIFLALIVFSLTLKPRKYLFTYFMFLFSMVLWYSKTISPYFLIPSIIGLVWMIYIFLRDLKVIFKVKTSFFIIKFKNYFLGIFVFIEFLSLIRWLTIPLSNSKNFYNGWTWIPAIVDRNISAVIQQFTSLDQILYISLAYFWIAFALFQFYEYRSGEKGIYQKTWMELKKKLKENFGVLKTDISLMDKPIILFSLALFLSVLPFIYLYNPTINPKGGFIGVDMPHYNTAFKELAKVKDFGVAAWMCMTSVMGGQRPIYFLLLYTIYRGFNLSITDVIRLEPVITTLLMTVAVYFLILEWMNNKKIAGFISLFTPLGVLTVGGIYGGFYANWLAWIWITFSLGFLAEYLRLKNYLPLILSMIFSALALFTHPWFWDVYITAVFLYFISLLIETRKPRKMIKWKNIGIASFLAVNAIVDVLKEWIYKMFGAYSAAVNVYSMNWIGVIWIPDFWRNLENAFMFYLAGVYNNWLLLTLSIIGVASLLIVDDDISRIFSIWIIILSLFLPFVHLEPFSRIFLLFPYHIIYPIGLVYVLNSEYERDKTSTLLIFTLVLFIELNYVFRSLFTLI